ncbi:MAG: peptidoglycan editing factor PgeF [Alphaproteobacteria bacterium]|nr:peptidoglycan editing factor PgeF [Alphaproteobacteria bacterium]
MDGFVEGQNEGKVFHGFFGRQGGVSHGIYSSLNCGPGSDDDPQAVRDNRRIVAQAAGCDVESLLSLHQVHGNACVTVDTLYDPYERPKADAHVTDQVGIALGVLTADCTPILFHGHKDNGAPVIGAAHAGWGGALKGASASVVEAMIALGASPESIVACIGPCISQASYEVSDDFLAPFTAEDADHKSFFIPSVRKGHMMFDLAGYNGLKARKAGVARVLIKELDTYFNEEDFFSYRRTTHRSEGDYGRQISVIKIN